MKLIVYDKMIEVITKNICRLLFFAALMMCSGGAWAAIIKFADQQVKKICTDNWDTDDDGELSELEASRIVDIGEKFARTSITSFDELQYFTGLTKLESRAFEWCESLKSVILPEGLKNVDGFWYSALESVVIPESVTMIDIAAFCGCSALKDVTVKWTTPVKPGYRAFEDVQLENCTLHHPYGTEKIYRSAEVWKEFNVAPDSIVFADPNVKAICLQWDADGDTHLSQIEAEMVTDLGKGFQSSAITSFDELKYFTRVKSLKATFSTCSQLKSITIPANIDTIEDNTFINCRNLKNLTVCWTTPLMVNNNVFKNWSTNTFRNCTLHIPLGTLTAYKNADVWKKFNILPSDFEFADSNVEEICLQLWDTDKNGILSEAEVVDITDLGDAFKENTEITSFDELKYFKKLSTIEGAAFFGCSSLRSVTIPDGVTSIRAMAFSGCTSLQTISIPRGLNDLGTQAFYGCISLQSVAIPEGVTRLGNYTFSGCSSLKDVTVSWETPLEVDDRVFNDVKLSDCNLHIPLETLLSYREADTWKDFHIKSAAIEFADMRVKAICVENWDLDGDGKLSEGEAMDVTDLGNLFDNETNITSFNELRYFIGLKGIGKAAFYGCSSLKSITIPDSVVSIGDYAFCECGSLPSILIPENVTNIGEYAFSMCSSLSSIVIPNDVISIDNGAFKGCTALQSVAIPRSVTSIGSEAFSGCTGLQDVSVKWIYPLKINENVFDGLASGKCRLHVLLGTETAYKSADVWKKFLCVVDKTIMFVDSKVERICVENWDTDKDGAFSYVEAEAVQTLGAAFKGTIITTFTELGYFTRLTGIESDAFAECTYLKQIILPKDVKSIGEKAFSGCILLDSLTIPKSVASIGNYAFFKCSNLVKLIVEWTTPIRISSNVFDGVDLGNCALHIPERVFDAYRTAEVWKKFKIITPNIVFADSEVKRLCIQNWDKNANGELSEEEAMAVMDLGNVFSGTSGYQTPITSFDELQYFTGLKSIGINAFAACEYLKSVIIPDGVNVIEHNSFQGCKALSSISFPKSLQNINSNAFDGCTSLQIANIPQSVNSIGDYAFRNCIGLMIVQVGWTTTPLAINSKVFNGVTLGNCWLRVPRGTENKYKTQSVWKDFKMDVELVFADQKVKDICLENWDADKDGILWRSDAMAVKDLGTVFRGTAITVFDELKYFTGLQRITSRAFEKCESMRSISLPESLTIIESTAFGECRSLQSINIPSRVNSIAEKTFYRCDALQSVNIPSGVSSIAKQLFYRCYSLRTVKIPSSVTKIGNSAFWGCESLQAIDIPSSVTEISSIAFHRCYSLKSINIPPKVTVIETSTFQACTSLQSINIPQGVKTIGRSAFADCDALQSVNISKSVEEIMTEAFSNCKTLKNVTVGWSNPLKIDANVFKGVQLSNCTLHVPKMTENTYRYADVWKDFGIITYSVTSRSAGISETESFIPDFSSGEEEIYDLNGRKLSAPQRGKVNIIRTKSGQTIKRM